MNDKVITHGESRKVKSKRTKEYIAWCNMIQRCEDKTLKSYHNYGGRGISICRRWRESYTSFLADMGRAPSSKHSIDRIDNDGNYEPGNVRWATPKEQIANQRPEAKARRLAAVKSPTHREAQRRRTLERLRTLGNGR